MRTLVSTCGNYRLTSRRAAIFVARVATALAKVTEDYLSARDRAAAAAEMFDHQHSVSVVLGVGKLRLNTIRALPEPPRPQRRS